MRRPIVVGAFLGLGLLILVFVFLFPKGREAAQTRSEIAAAQERLTALESELASLRQVDAGALAAELASLRVSIPSSPDLPGLLRTIEGAATGADVKLLSIGPGAPTASSSASVSVVPLSMSSSGTYFRLTEFLFELETLDRLNKISSVSVSQAGGVEGETGNVLTMAVSTEVYTTDASVGPGSDPAPGPEVGA